jgi:hypothetical protein
MQSNYKILKIALGFLCFIQFPAYPQWLWSDHYYEIKYHRDVIHAKGKPVIDGDFTVFTKWPENLEWRVKTKDVALIKDIGPLSPEENQEKKLKSIFTDYSIEDGFFSTDQLKLARSNGFSDREIWDFWIKKNQKFKEAKDEGISLDILAEALGEK